MDTIKNYLEAMFANIPDTAQSRRAKQELLAMMEDKYNELKASGMPENEIIGTIISEFGNTEDLMEFLGREQAQPEPEVVDVIPSRTVDAGRRVVSLDEAYSYISDITFSRFLLGAGVFFCILSPLGPVLFSGLGEIFFLKVFSGMFEAIGVTLLFVCVAIGVGLILFSTSKNRNWEFLDKEPCILDPNAEQDVQQELVQNQNSKNFLLAVGVLLCIISVTPVTFFGIFPFSGFLTEALGPALIFPLVGAGVFCILNSTRRTGPCETLLGLKEKTA